MGDVVIFHGVTVLDFDPDRVLSAAVGELECVVVIGRTKYGEEYFASSLADGGDVLWMMERAKKALLEISDECGCGKADD